MYKCIKDYIKNINIVIGCNIGCFYCYARNNCNRYHITPDFSTPVFYESKLKLLDKDTPSIFLLTGMSDLSVWTNDFLNLVLEKIKQNPHNHYLFLTKRPDLLNIECDLDNAWFGVTVTSSKEKWKIDSLKENVKAKHYHVTFEPLFDYIGDVNLDKIDWIVVGTMTGKDSKKIKSDVNNVLNITKQAQTQNVKVFWKEDLAPIMGDDLIVQEFPKEFNECLIKDKICVKK